MRFLANLTNFLTGFVAVVLSFALVLALMTVPLLVMVHELLEPEMLHELLISASQNLSDESSGDTQAAMMQKLMEIGIIVVYIADIRAGGREAKQRIIFPFENRMGLCDCSAPLFYAILALRLMDNRRNVNINIYLLGEQ